MCSEALSTRKCIKCGSVRPLTEEYFYRRKDTQGFRGECKVCIREYRLMKKLNIDFKWYTKQLLKQKRKCAICRSLLNSSRYTKFAVDHCHKTGRIRGLLCSNCNTALGLMKDSEERLTAAIDYLRNPPCDDIV